MITKKDKTVENELQENPSFGITERDKITFDDESVNMKLLPTNIDKYLFLSSLFFTFIFMPKFPVNVKNYTSSLNIHTTHLNK